MRLARVTGTVTATVKQPAFTGSKLMLIDGVDSAGDVKTASLVAVDTVGAGRGDLVLIAQGSAARMAGQTSTSPVDAAIVAVVDRVDRD